MNPETETYDPDIQMSQEDEKGNGKVLWWIMGIVAACCVVLATHFVGRFNALETISASRGERLMRIETELDARERYEIANANDLKTRLSRIETKVDELGQKISRMP